MRKALNVIFCCCTFFSMQLIQAQGPIDPEVQKLMAEHARRQAIMSNRLTDLPGVRSSMEDFSGATFLSETVIQDKAKAMNITTTEQEVHTFILPMLAMQGLVDYSCKDVFTDPNVQLWLKGQEMPLSDFKNAAKSTVLWAKIISQNISISEEEIKKYVTDNPGLAFAPARILFELTQFTPPPGISSRSVLAPEVLAPNMALGIRNSMAEIEKPTAEAHKHLQLRMELDKLDRVLRQAIGGLQVGDHFGPLLLANGAIVEGTIKGFIAEADFSKSPGFWDLVSIRARIEKVNQGEIFAQMTDSFIKNCPPEGVRGFWGKVWRGFKKSFSYMTGAGVGLAAFVSTGDPRVAYLGARYGYQMGNAIKGAFSSNSGLPVQMMKSIPGMIRNGNFQIPNAYAQFQAQPFSQVPAIPAGYAPQYWSPQYMSPNQGMPYAAQNAQGSQNWPPQMFFPMPVYY